MNRLFLVISVLAIVYTSTVIAFIIPTSIMRNPRLRSGLNMIVIKVDGNKVIESKEKTINLRKELQANKVDVYPLKAKLTGNCGGAGICGTCAVKVLDGAKNINPPSKNELNTLRGKPADFRLSCCARVTGDISIKTKP